MERLWAPWRIEYITSPKDNNECVLCAAPAGTNDEETLLVYRGSRNFILMNRFPYSPGHLLVAPYLHTADLADLSGETGVEHLELVRLCVDLLSDATRADGFNIGLNLGRVAGAGLDKHLHTHVVPRWQGDSNFMPVLADTRVMSESLSSMYSKLRNALERTGGLSRNPQVSG